MIPKKSCFALLRSMYNFCQGILFYYNDFIFQFWIQVLNLQQDLGANYK